MKNLLDELDGKDYTADIYRDYDIRFAEVDEYEDLREFLKLYWKEKHIFVLSRELFDFQHLDKKNNRYNFVVARAKLDNEIHAILGFVPTSQYDDNISNLMVWPCIWKNRDDIKRRGLGATMYYHLKNSLDIETISILGISEVALGIYKYWNFKSGVINQYVMPNFQADEHLSEGLLKHYNAFTAFTEDTMFLTEVGFEEYSSLSENDEMFQEYKQYKSKMYYLNRFLKHPMYKYKFLGIKDNSGKIRAIVVVRSCGDGNVYCIRVVDYIGKIEHLNGVKNQIQKYLQENRYEYIDFVEVGLCDAELRRAGFVNRRDFDDIIVPNYFEPFVKANVDLDYAYKSVSDDAKCVFFKADADQDRPNVLE